GLADIGTGAQTLDEDGFLAIVLFVRQVGDAQRDLVVVHLVAIGDTRIESRTGWFVVLIVVRAVSDPAFPEPVQTRRDRAVQPFHIPAVLDAAAHIVVGEPDRTAGRAATIGVAQGVV